MQSIQRGKKENTIITNKLEKYGFAFGYGAETGDIFSFG